MADETLPTEPQPTTGGAYSFEAFQRRLAAAQPGQYPAYDEMRKQQAQQQLSDEGIDHEQLGNDDWDLMKPGSIGEAIFKHRGEENAIGRTGHAIARGGLEAYNAINRAATSGALHIADAFLDDPGHEAAFNKVFNTPMGKRDFATTISDETLDKIAPPQSGLNGVLTGLTEFGVEFAATGAIGKLAGGVALAATEGTKAVDAVGAVGKALTTFDKTTLGSGAVKMAFTQFLFTDPYAKRVSNMIAESPPELSGPMLSWINEPIKKVAGAFAADPTDPLGKAHFKNMVEGFIIGMPFAVAGALLGSTVKRLSRALEAKEITESEAQVLLKEAHADYAKDIEAGQAKMDDPNAASSIVEHPDGQRQVILKGPDGKEIPGPKFATDAEANVAKASIDMHHAAAQEAASPITQETIKDFQARFAGLGEHPNVDSVAKLMEETGINKKYLKSKDAIDAIKALVGVAPEDASKLRAKPTGWGDSIKLTKELFPEMSTKDVLATAKRLRLETDTAPAVVTGVRAFLTLQSREVKKLSMLVSKYPGNGALENHLVDAVQALHSVHAEFVGSGANIARAMQIRQMPMTMELAKGLKGGATEGAEKAAPAEVQNLTREEAKKLAQVIGMNKDQDIEGVMKLLAAPTEAQAKAAPDAARASIGQRILAARTEFILSSPKTQAVNVISSIARLIQNPTELAMAGAKDIIKGEGTETMHQAWDLAAGQMLSSFDALKFAIRSFEQGRPILDPGNFIAEKAVSSGSLKEGMLEGPWSAVKTMLSTLLPGRTLTASDEFFSQALYRSRARMDVLAGIREQVDQGILKGTKEELDAITKERLSALSDDMGRGVYQPGLDYAREGTFKTDLTGVPKGFQELVNTNGMARFFFPFIRTPYNIFDYVWQGTPGLNAFNKRMQAAIQKGGPDAKMAIARAELGTMVYGFAAYLAASGTITGGGPSNPETQKTWRQYNQPYSFKLPDGSFVSYRRGDTFFSALGIMADVYAASGNMNEEDRVSSMAALANVFTSNALNRSYMSNVDTLFAAMSAKDGGDAMSRLMGSALGSFVPSVVKDVAVSQDPYERELHGIWDAVKARVPGYSQTLEPRMNLFGEPVMGPPGLANEALNPFTIYGPQKDPFVSKELDKLGRNLPGLPDTKDGIDLLKRNLRDDGKSLHTRWYELMAETGLRKDLTKLIKGPAWGKLTGDDAYAPGGQKYLMVTKLVDLHRQAAWGKLLKETPALRQAYAEEQKIKAAGAVGGKAAASAKTDEIRQLGGLLHRN